MNFEKLTVLINERITGEWGQEATSSAVKVIRTTNFTNEGTLDLSNVVERDIDKKKIEKKVLRKGDIIIEKSGGGPTQPVGRVVFFDLDSNEKYLCNNFSTILRPNKNLVDPKYLLYQMLFMHKSGRTKKYQNKTTGIHNLILEKYLQERVALPSLPDQLHIANLLSKAETLISQRKESIRLLDQYLKSTFLEMFGDPVRNEKGWKIKPLNDLVDKLGDGLHGTPIYDDEGEYYFINGNNLENGYIRTDEKTKKVTFEEYKKYYKELNEKTILVSINGTLGRVAFYKSEKIILGKSACYFNLKNNSVNQIFLYHFLQSEFFLKYVTIKATGSTINNVSLKTMRELPIILPPHALQTHFAQIVEKTETLKAQYQQSLQEMENLYGSLSQKAFKGELTMKEEYLSQTAEQSMEYKKTEKF